MRRTVTLTERDLTRLINRVINEDLSVIKGELYSSINKIINREFEDVETSDIVEVLSSILRHHEGESYRKKKGIGYITKDEVIKNFKK
jgi:predicted transcriptional regulator